MHDKLEKYKHEIRKLKKENTTLKIGLLSSGQELQEDSSDQNIDYNKTHRLFSPNSTKTKRFHRKSNPQKTGVITPKRKRGINVEAKKKEEEIKK